MYNDFLFRWRSLVQLLGIFNYCWRCLVFCFSSYANLSVNFLCDHVVRQSLCIPCFQAMLNSILFVFILLLVFCFSLFVSVFVFLRGLVPRSVSLSVGLAPLSSSFGLFLFVCGLCSFLCVALCKRPHTCTHTYTGTSLSVCLHVYVGLLLSHCSSVQVVCNDRKCIMHILWGHPRYLEASDFSVVGSILWLWADASSYPFDGDN